MKKLKSIIAILLALSMSAGLCSCAAKASDGAMNAAVAMDAALTQALANTQAALEVPAEYYAADGMSDEEIAFAEEAAKASIEAAEKAAAIAAEAAAKAAAEAAAKMGIELESVADNGTPIYPPELRGRLVENPFIKTTELNVSTFSADVDTASYTYFRKLVNYGWSLKDIIQQEGSSLRTEELINYFDYDYVEPAAGELFGVKSQIAPCPWNEDAVLLQLGLKADDAVESKGNNLVFLIDVSGSMRTEDKLPLLQQAFTFLTETLTKKDTVSIVTYSGKEAVVLEGCNGTFTKKILNAIDKLDANGSTNGQAGIQKAYEIAKKYYIEGGNNRIIMASDGDLNVGISRADELKDFISEKRDEGIYLSVLGFGTGNYRDANMEALADNGNGVYYYIDGTSEAERVFGTDLLGTLYTVAEDVKLQLTFDPQYVAEYRLVGYENRMLNEEDFADDTKDAGELGAGHTVTVCYELILTNAYKETNSNVDLMKLAIRHKAPGETTSKLNEYTISDSAYTTAPDEDFLFICAVTELAMILHESEYAKDSTLDSILITLNSLPLDDPYKVEFRDLLRRLNR